MQKCTPAIASSAINLIEFFGLRMERAITSRQYSCVTSDTYNTVIKLIKA